MLLEGWVARRFPIQIGGLLSELLTTLVRPLEIIIDMLKIFFFDAVIIVAGRSRLETVIFQIV
jgi:hypothetical protein